MSATERLDELIQPHKSGAPGLDSGSDPVDLSPSNPILGATPAIKAVKDGPRICNANTVASYFDPAGAGRQLLVSTAQPRDDVEKANICHQKVIEILDRGWPRLPRVMPIERGTFRPLWMMQGDRMNITSKVRYRLQVPLVEGGGDIQITRDECRAVGDEDQRARQHPTHTVVVQRIKGRHEIQSRRGIWIWFRRHA